MYRYEPLSFRLRQVETTRTSDSATLQKTTYTHDAVGNIVHTADAMDDSVYFTSAPAVSADQDFTYDAVYRLVEATGREHEGTVEDTQYDDQEGAIHAVPHPNNPNGFRAYTQEWQYDKIGNITQFKHLAGPSNSAGWTRDYSYTSGTNRLASTSHPGGSKSYSHDAHGNLVGMPHLSALHHDFADQLRHVEITSGQDVWFVYDADGDRARKVWITNSGNLRRERIYLGGYEVWRRYNKVAGNWVRDDERQTLHVADDARRVCMIETLTWEDESEVTSPAPRRRFQLDNHLGTACVELDESAAVISLEECHPYGTSSFRSFTSSEVSAKRYRYTGMSKPGSLINWNEAMTLLRNESDPIASTLLEYVTAALAQRFAEGSAPSSDLDTLYLVQTLAEVFRDKATIQRILDGERPGQWFDDEM